MPSRSIVHDRYYCRRHRCVWTIHEWHQPYLLALWIRIQQSHFASIKRSLLNSIWWFDRESHCSLDWEFVKRHLHRHYQSNQCDFWRRTELMWVCDNFDRSWWCLCAILRILGLREWNSRSWSGTKCCVHDSTCNRHMQQWNRCQNWLEYSFLICTER